MLALPGGFRYPLVFVCICMFSLQNDTELCGTPATMMGRGVVFYVHSVVVTLDPIVTTAATQIFAKPVLS